MRHKNFTIKTMTRNEVDIAIDWAAKEGWNPGHHDADCYYAVDPNGFLIGLYEDEPIATISVIKYGHSFGFLGFYIVKPEYRDKGYGIQIWYAGLKYLEGRNIGLDGVVAQQENYKESGFKLAYRNIRYEGFGGGDPPGGSEIVTLSTLPFEIIKSYDQPFFPENRSKLVKAWIKQPESHALGIMQNGKLSSCGVIRTSHNGHKIGPLFADNSELTESLFQALRSKTKPAESVFLDTPKVNQSAVALAERYNMKISFETARMYTGNFPDISLNRIFGVTSFEVG